MDQGTSSTNSGSMRSEATSPALTVYLYEQKACLRIAYTDKNFDKKFMKCENYKINRPCAFWECINPKICEYGERVVAHLRKWHLSLTQEAERCQTLVESEVAKAKANMEVKEAERRHIMVETKVGKVKTLMETKNAALRKQLEIVEINCKAMKSNYQTIILCTWILIIVYLFLTGFTSKGVFDGRHNRMLLA